MAPPPLLISAFTQSILYGIYIVTLASCIRWLSYEDKGWIVRKKVNWPILTVALFLWACLTAYLLIFFQITLDVMFIGPPKQILLNVLAIIAGIARIIADAVLIHRCWEVHARSWRIVALPIALWLSCVASLGLLAGSHHKPYLGTTVFISCHIANNIYGTSAIVYMIIRVAQTSNDNSRRLKKTARIFMESALVYTASGVLNLIFQANTYLHNTYMYTACIIDIFNLSMTGITFNLIILRTGQERANPRTDFVDSKFIASGVRRLSGFKDSQSQNQD